MEDNLKSPITYSHILRFVELPKSKTQQFDITFPPEALKEAAINLNLVSLEKCRLKGTLKPAGKRDWVLDAHLGATAIQECVVTLAPVKTRIDQKLTQRYTPDAEIPQNEPDIIIEMNADVDVEPLPESLDLVQVALEALVLNLPEYPRADDAALHTSTFAADGVKPLQDEDLKPFAGLAALKSKMDNK